VKVQLVFEIHLQIHQTVYPKKVYSFKKLATSPPKKEKGILRG
jgi:hypothetical protein